MTSPVAPIKVSNLDGVAKTPQLLRCCIVSLLRRMKPRLIAQQLRALHLALFA